VLLFLILNLCYEVLRRKVQVRLRNPEFLRRNKKEGKYLNLEHYLDVQFRLYREDFISPLRNAVKEYMQFTQIQRGQHGHGRGIRLEDGRLYQNVMITV
jgi:hypothetical protein